MRALVLISLALLAVRDCRPTPKPGDRRAGRTYRVMIIGDGYVGGGDPLAAIEQTTDDAFTFIRGTTSANLKIRTKLLKVQKTGDSRLGLTYHGRPADCYFAHGADVFDRIYAHTPSDFKADFYIVSLAGAGGGACSDGNVMFVRGNVTKRTLIHELGHAIAGLYDEYSFTDDPYPRKCLKWRNCSTDSASPPWVKAGSVAAFQRCDGYLTGIYHPAAACRMSDPDAQVFCDVCRHFLDEALTSGVLGRLLPPGGGCTGAPLEAHPWNPFEAKTALDVVAIIDQDDGITVVAASPAEGDAVNPQVIVGDKFAVAYDGAKVVAVAPLAIDSGDPSRRLSARSYSPKGKEVRVPQPYRLVRFTLADVSLESLPKRHLRLGIRRLEDARDFLFVDIRTVDQLGRGFTEPEYNLQSALLLATR